MIHHMKKWVATLALAASVAMPGASYATNGASVIGVGAKSRGMGGVGVALPQDAFAGTMNPAGIAYQGDRLDVGFGYVWQDGKTIFRPAGSTEQPLSFSSDEGLWMPEAAISWEFCPCQVIGIAFWSPGSFRTSYDVAVFSAPEVPTGGNTKGFWYTYNVTPTWAWRINSVSSIGVGVNISFNWFEADGVGLATTGAVPGSTVPSLFPNDVTNRGTDLREGLSFHVGWMGQFCDTFRLGASFQTETWTGKHKKYQGFLVDEGEINWPWQAGIGFSWTCMPCITIAGDFVYRIWQGSDQFENTSRDGFSLDPVTEEILFPGSFGYTGGPGFGWKNQPIVKLGVAWDIWPCLTVRAGYNYGESPIVPTETMLNSLTLDTQEHHVTLGASYKWACHELSVYYYHAFEKTVKGNGSVYTGSEYDNRNAQNAAGIQYGMWF